MRTLSRRTFTAWLVGMASFPAIARAFRLPGDGQEKVVLPARVAGRDLSDDEKQLVKKYLEGYEQTMTPLRARDLPNALSPAFHFVSPRLIARKGDNNGQR